MDQCCDRNLDILSIASSFSWRISTLYLALAELKIGQSFGSSIDKN